MQERNLCSLGITVAPLFQNNAMFLLTIMLIYDDSLLSGQPPLSGHLPAPRVWPLREVELQLVLWVMKLTLACVLSQGKTVGRREVSH